MRRLGGNFEAENDNGKRYEVLMYYEEIVHFSLSGPPQVSKGTRSYSLRDGSEVWPVLDDLDAFTVVKSGTVIRTV
jgi:hypothetical protein